MVKLLRISGIAALALAGLVLASILGPVRPLGLGIAENPESSRFLDSPTAVVRFKSLQETQAPDMQDKTPPLVREAETLAGIINPRIVEPPSPVAVTPRGVTAPTITKPVMTTAQFGLVGVCYSPSDPHNSFAYIRLPDNTYQWVKQGQEVGHLTVQEVKAGSILCSDGQRISEMAVESVVDTASLLETGSGSASPIVSSSPMPGMNRPNLRTSWSDRAAAGPTASSRLNAQEEQGLNELVQKLKQELQKNPLSERAGDSNAASGDRAAELNKLISEFKSSRVSPQEAEKLEDLGEKLNEEQVDPAEARRRELIKRLNMRRPAQ